MNTYDVFNKSIFKKIGKYNYGLQHKFKFTQIECNNIIDLINIWSLELINNSEFIDRNFVNKVNKKYFYKKYVQNIYDRLCLFVNYYTLNNLPYCSNNTEHNKDLYDHLDHWIYKIYYDAPIYDLINICCPVSVDDNTIRHKNRHMIHSRSEHTMNNMFKSIIKFIEEKLEKYC